jgi:hypothetical protein
MFKSRTSKSTCSVEGPTQVVTAGTATFSSLKSGPCASKTLREGTRCRTTLMEPTCFRYDWPLPEVRRPALFEVKEGAPCDHIVMC